MSAMRWKVCLVFGLASVCCLTSRPLLAQENGQEALTRGPVHEAFAEPTIANPVPPLAIAAEAPAPIEELPPDVKPEGNNVVWISGYWGWDESSNRFLWISGIWRDAPPGFIWVPGYWTKTNAGSQWTPGFWSPQQQSEVSYLPQPPESLEEGPTTPAPDPRDFWVPGVQQWHESHFVWRPGYWTAGQANWIWSPAHYSWTPSGYVFIPGHWDYLLANRGVLFAPIAFSEPIYERRHFVFSPSVVIDANLLTVNFFVRPSTCHYYFGDYYGQSFVTLGFHPWFSVGVHSGYDPLFSYYRWEHRDEPHWHDHIQEHFTYMDRHPDSRPPHTFVQQTTIVNNNTTVNHTTVNHTTVNNTTVNNVQIGSTLNQYVKNVNNTSAGGGARNVKFVDLSKNQRQDFATQAVKEQGLANERAKLEASTGGTKPNIGVGSNPSGSPPKSLNLQKLTQATGGKLPGGSPGEAIVGGSKTRLDGHVPSTSPGPTTTGGPSSTGGPTTTGGPTRSGPTTTSPDAFHLKTGETLKGGDTSNTTLGPSKTGPLAGPKLGDTSKPITGPKSGDTSKPITGPKLNDTIRPLVGPKLGDINKPAPAAGPTGPTGGPSGNKPSGSGIQPGSGDTGHGRVPSSGGDPSKKPKDPSKDDPRAGKLLFQSVDPNARRSETDRRPVADQPVIKAKDVPRAFTTGPTGPTLSTESRAVVQPSIRPSGGQAASGKDPVRPMILSQPQPQPKSTVGPAVKDNAATKDTGAARSGPSNGRDGSRDNRNKDPNDKSKNSV